MKRGIYAESVDGLDVMTFKIGHDGSIALELGTTYESMAKWLSPFDNRNNRVWWAVPEDLPPKYSQRGWDNAWCVFRCSGCHRSISSQRETLMKSGWSFIRPSQATRQGPMFFQMIPVAVNVESSWFFDGVCWGEKSCIDADPALYDRTPDSYDHVKKIWSDLRIAEGVGKAQIENGMEEVNGRWTEQPRSILGYATRECNSADSEIDEWDEGGEYF